MTKPDSLTRTELMSAQEITLGDDGAVPDWIQLLPASADGRVETYDARGPFLADDLAAIAAASMAGPHKVIIDECHATDLAAPKGAPAPARGYIVEMQARSDGLWGRVDWTEEGRRLVAGRAYYGISPVTAVERGTKRILRIPRASLVNEPNFTGLKHLNFTETDTMLKEHLIKTLGLAEDADEEAIIAALDKAMADKAGGEDDSEMNAALGSVAEALGLAKDAKVDTILNAAKARPSVDDLAALKAEFEAVQTQLNAVQQERAREASAAYVDGEIAKGRAFLKPKRDVYIELHAQDPERARELIEAMPILDTTHARVAPPPAREGELQLNHAQAEVAAQLGMSAEDYAKALAADQKKEAV